MILTRFGNFLVDLDDITAVRRVDDGAAYVFLRSGQYVEVEPDDAEKLFAFFEHPEIVLNPNLKRQPGQTGHLVWDLSGFNLFKVYPAARWS